MSAMIRSAVVGLLLVSGCGGGFAPPPIEAGALAQEQEERAVRLISDRIALSGRLRDIEFSIVTESAAFCRGVERPAVGVVLASEASFSGKIARTAAREELALGEQLTVVHVVPGGPLDVAGVKANDRVLTVAGVEAKTQEAFQDAIGGKLEPFVLRIARDTQELEKTVRPFPACPVSLRYVQSAQLLPDKLSRTTAGLPRGVIRLFENDDELAVVIGHQLAHLIFEQPGQDEIERERRADRLGLFLTARAGYDISGAVGVWEKLVQEYPWLGSPQNPDRYRAYPHQGVAMRVAGLEAAIREIEDLRARSQPLVPAGD